MYFQEQLRRRREEEERIAQQNEFLRASLRGSRKLQALQDNHPLASEQRPPAGIDNDAFIADEDVERILGKWVMLLYKCAADKRWLIFKLKSFFAVFLLMLRSMCTNAFY